MRNQRGFTLIFAVILCVIFAGLLYSIYYLLAINVKESSKTIFEQQARYLAESGNNRAMSMLNVMKLPDIDAESIQKDDWADDEWDDDDFDSWDDDFFDEEEWDDLDEDNFGEDDSLFLIKIPRYINFYHKFPYYVNIDTGSVITEQAYFAMINAQQQRIQQNKSQAAEQGTEFQQQEILIEELYFPLPEVNVMYIGSIPIEKGVHLKPGFKVQLAQKIPVDLKRSNIVNEYFNFIPEYKIELPKPILRNITPNFAYQGEYLNIYMEGENLDNIVPVFNSQDIELVSSGSGSASIAISETAKPGKYQVQVGKFKTDFFITPMRDGSPTPIINEIRLPEFADGNNQFIKIADKAELKNLKIMGENLIDDAKDKPLIIPDGIGFKIDVISYKSDEIVFNIKTDKPSIGSHYISIYTAGGQSSAWIFNVEEGEVEEPEAPDQGSFTTLLTLLEVNSLSNLPFSASIDASSEGRPDQDSGAARPNSNQGGRAASSNSGPKRFNLLKSDLELVWKVETIATVNKHSFKETRIIRRSVPQVEAALTTNNSVVFGQSSIKFEGILEASTRLEESTSSGDTIIYVEGDDPFAEDLRLKNDEPRLSPTGQAVVEDFNFGTRSESPQGRGFLKDALIAIVSFSRGDGFSDIGFIESLGDRTITVKKPGFRTSHFRGDEVIQFKPSIITPEPISEREATRTLEPPGSFANLPGKTNFEYVFRTSLEKLEHWTKVTRNTNVPSSIKSDVDGYFGLNIIRGTPSYTGGNSLYGQGTLIIDTTDGGYNPMGSTVSIGGSTKLPSIFDGVIYIIGNLQITGPIEVSGGIVVNSPNDGKTIRVSGAGNVSYNLKSIQKAIIHLPFVEELRTRLMERSRGQDELVGKKKQ
jgi:hypothetical protein